MGGQRKYLAELRERTVEMVRELEREMGQGRGAIARVARDLGIHKEALRNWVRQDQQVHRPGGGAGGEPAGAVPVDKDARIKELEARLREVERANAILKVAASFFAKKLDSPPPKW
ncbi:transposase [Nocardia miyunensis]|uniref:transposase n=1 Tax=Nocardia miyunensis TaxID=282684 RepID=UPI00082FC09E|nr:transposase [Nocardia miyunensis]